MRDKGCFLYDLIIFKILLLFVCEDAVRMDIAVQNSRSNAGLWLWIFFPFSTVLKNILTYNKEFPFDVQPVPLR